MSYTRTLTLVPNQLPSVIDGRDTVGSFSVTFEPPFMLGGKQAQNQTNSTLKEDWEVALISISLFNSIPNISAQFGNDLFRYTQGATTYNHTFTAGIYNIAGINAQISAWLLADGHPAPYDQIVLTPNISTAKITITVAATFTVIFVGNLNLLLGYDLAQSPLLAGNTEANNIANLNNDVSAYLIRSDVVEGSTLNSSTSDVLYTYQPIGRPSASINIIVPAPIYVKCKSNQQFARARFYITDDLGRVADYRGEALTMLLQFRRVKKNLY